MKYAYIFLKSGVLFLAVGLDYSQTLGQPDLRPKAGSQEERQQLGCHHGSDGPWPASLPPSHSFSPRPTVPLLCSEPERSMERRSQSKSPLIHKHLSASISRPKIPTRPYRSLSDSPEDQGRSSPQRIKLLSISSQILPEWQGRDLGLGQRG